MGTRALRCRGRRRLQRERYCQEGRAVSWMPPFCPLLAVIFTALWDYLSSLVLKSCSENCSDFSLWLDRGHEQHLQLIPVVSLSGAVAQVRLHRDDRQTPPSTNTSASTVLQRQVTDCLSPVPRGTSKPAENFVRSFHFCKAEA